MESIHYGCSSWSENGSFEKVELLGGNAIIDERHVAEPFVTLSRSVVLSFNL